MSKNLNIMGAILIIAGTSIGAGMLALPIETSKLGFTYSSILFFFCWFFMSVSALYMLEATLQFNKKDINLTTIAEKSLGVSGKVIAWSAYLILLYALTAAYANGASSWLINTIKNAFAIELSLNIIAPIIALLLSLITFTGTVALDYVNRFFSIGLTFCLALFFIITIPYSNIELINNESNVFSLNPLPLIITSFGFHIVIPSLTTYFNRNSELLKKSILVGSFIPLVIYLLWQFAIMGNIPMNGEISLESIKLEGKPTIGIPNAIIAITKISSIYTITSALAILAVVTSVIGVTMSLFDFLSDALKLKKANIKHFLFLVVVVFIPPLFFVLNYPQGYNYALSFAGIFVAVLLGILPVVMVYCNRYIHKRKNIYYVLGGKPLLFSTFLFFASIIFIEIFSELGYNLDF